MDMIQDMYKIWHGHSDTTNLKIERHDTTIIQHKKNSLNYKINIKHKAQIKKENI